MPPVFGALTKEFKDDGFSQTVDIFRHPRFSEQLGVRAIPTVLSSVQGARSSALKAGLERTLRYYLRRVSAEHTGGPLPGADDGESVAPAVETEAPSLPKRLFSIFRK
jgi:hypothetical protein